MSVGGWGGDHKSVIRSSPAMQSSTSCFASTNCPCSISISLCVMVCMCDGCMCDGVHVCSCAKCDGVTVACSQGEGGVAEGGRVYFGSAHSAAESQRMPGHA